MPRPLAEMPDDVRRGIRVVLTDIDDTLTSHGKLTASAYAALERLHASGRIVVPVTGRPAGWCDHIARMWPVDAVVGENGAFYMHFEAARRKLVRRFVEGDADRAAQRARIAAIGAAIVNGVPGSALASDQQYRETDLAIDYCEDVPPLPREAVDRIVALMQAQGMTAKVSSIHVNGWFGSYDKLAMTRTLMREVFVRDIDAERARVRVRRRFAERRANVRVLRKRGRRRERAPFPAADRDASRLRHDAGSGCRLCRVRRRAARASMTRSRWRHSACVPKPPSATLLMTLTMMLRTIAQSTTTTV